MVEVVSADVRRQAQEQARRITEQQREIGRQQRQLQTARGIRQIPRTQRQIQSQRLGGASTQLASGQAELTRISQLPTPEEVIASATNTFKEQLDVAKKVAFKKNIPLSSIPDTQLRDYARQLREGVSDNEIIAGLEKKFQQSLPAEIRTQLLTQVKQGSVPSFSAQSIPFEQVQLPNPQVRLQDNEKFPLFFQATPSQRISSISKAPVSKSLLTRLSRQGIRPDSSPIERNVETLTTRPQPKRVTTITTDILPQGTNNRGTIGVTQRAPNINDVGKGILPPFQEAEIKTEDVFTRFSQGRISETQANAELKRIEKQYILAETKRQLPATIGSGLAIGAISAIAPPIGLAIGAGFTAQAIKNRKEIKTFAKENPKAAAIQFVASIGSGIIGGGGLSALKSRSNLAKLEKIEPKIKLTSSRVSENIITDIIEQVEPNFKLKSQTGDISGVKNYQVTLPTSQGKFELFITEYEKNGVKTFAGTELIGGEVRPVLIRGQSLVKGKEGLSQIITRVVKASQKDQKPGIVLGKRNSPTKFNIEVRELIEQVKTLKDKKFKEDTAIGKIVTKQLSVSKSDVREPIVTKSFLARPSRKIIDKIRSGKKVSDEQALTAFQKQVVKKLELKGVKPDLAKKFIMSNLFGKEEIVNKLKEPFTKEQFNKDIKQGNTKFLLERQLTKFDIERETIGGSTRIQVKRLFSEKGKSISKKSNVKIMLKKKELKFRTPPILKESANRLSGTGKPKQPFKKLSKIKIKPLIEVAKKERAISSGERLVLETIGKSKIKLKEILKTKKTTPSPLGTFGELAKSSARGIEKSIAKQNIIKSSLLGAGLPRAVGGLGRNIQPISQIGFGKPRVSIETEGVLSLAKKIPEGNKITTTQIQDLTLKANQGTTSLLSSVNKLSLQQKSLLLNGQRLTQPQLNNLALTPVEKLKIELASKLIQQQKLQQKQRQKQLSRVIQRPRKEVNKPKTKIGTFDDLDSFGSKVRPIGTPINQKGYDVYVKQKKKFLKINKVPITKEKAKDLGSYITDKSLSATWKIKQTKVKARKPAERIPLNYYNSNKYKFRGKIVRGKKIPLIDSGIEKSKYRLDSFSEVKKIQAARLSKQLGRSFFKPVKRLIRRKR